MNMLIVKPASTLQHQGQVMAEHCNRNLFLKKWPLNTALKQQFKQQWRIMVQAMAGKKTSGGVRHVPSSWHVFHIKFRYQSRQAVKRVHGCVAAHLVHRAIHRSHTTLLKANCTGWQVPVVCLVLSATGMTNKLDQIAENENTYLAVVAVAILCQLAVQPHVGLEAVLWQSL